MANRFQKRLLKPQNNGGTIRDHQPINKLLTGNLPDVEMELRNAFHHTEDLKIEKIRIGEIEGLLCYLYTMCDLNLMTERILKPVSLRSATVVTGGGEGDLELLVESYFAGTQPEWITNDSDLLKKLLGGYAILIVSGIGKAVALFTQVGNQRKVEEPTTQTVVKGPKDGFVEDITTNLSLLRRRIRNPALKYESFTIGDDTGTQVVVAYLDGTANEGIVNEVRSRLKRIRTNAILESSNIEEFIVDKTLTPFPLAYNSERPDTTAAHLLSGKVAILVDGSPFVLTVPVLLMDFNASAEDYYQSFYMGTFLRMLRYVSFLMSLLMPSLYVAVITYHQELIPTPLLITVMSQREGVPFPAVVEAFIMEIVFEILREAGVRMPRAIGGTISIVGGLVIGQAAVEAGVISNFMVIVVALTAIASFVTPIYNFSIAARLLRFIFVVLAGTFGLYGILLGLIAMVGHLCSLRSFGAPYLAPIAPFNKDDQRDIFIRMPHWVLRGRTSALKTNRPGKQPLDDSPSPPEPKKSKEPYV